MSEIIASVYRKIEEGGRKEGILFIDEINCVSETLAPTMLQFCSVKRLATRQSRRMDHCCSRKSAGVQQVGKRF